MKVGWVITILARSGLLLRMPAALVRKLLKLFTVRKLQPEELGLSHAFSQRKLLIDVSVIHEQDAGTGIQRVTRTVRHHLEKNPPFGFTVCCVSASTRRPYYYIDSNRQLSNQKADPCQGDVFLGLDLAAHLVPKKLAQLTRWKLAGTALHFVVYDILPLTQAAHFTVARTRHFKAWVHSIARLADSLICISDAVRIDLERWLIQNTGLTSLQLPIYVIQLGGDFDSLDKYPPPIPRDRILQLLTTLQKNCWVLMVGTMEPRKCHGKVLDAFELLWKKDSLTSLVFIGQKGWHTESLQQRIVQHSEFNRKLYWISDANDSELKRFYQAATGVVVASIAEGYGLPLHEAMNFNKPLLVRDIPVFREVAGSSANYFINDMPSYFSDSIQTWLSNISITTEPVLNQSSNTWEDCTQQLLKTIEIEQNDLSHVKQ